MAQPMPQAAAVALIGVVLAFAALGVYASSMDLGFSADGAYHFIRVLENRAIMHFAWSRAYADYVQQWPLLLAVGAGISDLATLGKVFHLGLFLPFFLSFLICWYASRSFGNDELLLFPLASFVLVSLPASAILSGTSHVLAVIVWPILFLLLRPRLTLLDGVLLLGLLVIASRTYETAVVSLSILLAVLGMRPWHDSRSARPVLLALTVVALAGVAIAAYWALYPASTNGRHNFVEGLYRPMRGHFLFVFSAASLFLFACSLLTTRLRLLALPALALAAVSIALPAIARVPSADVSFNMRTLTLTLLPLLLLAAIGFHLKPRKLSSRQWIMAGMALVLLSAGYATSWQAWREFRYTFKNELATRNGYVPVDDTSVARSRQRWRWTAPMLSVLWSENCVRTVILNRPSSLWEPFDPRKELPLQSYLSYAAPFAAASPYARQCD